MPPNSLLELNRSLFHSHHNNLHETKEEENNHNNHNTNDSWLSCALASHGNSTTNVTTSTSTPKAPHPVKKQTIASMAMDDARVTQQSQLLESMVSTLTAKLRTQDTELKQFPAKHDRYVELFLALESVKELLECAVHENLQLKRRAKGLEAALAVQDIELDDHSSRMWNVAAMEAADNESKTTQQNNTNANAGADKNQEGNMQEHIDHLVTLERERDTAVKQATQLAIQLAESQAAVDDLRDKMIECKAVTEYFQQKYNNNNHYYAEHAMKIVDELPSTLNKMSFFWPRGGAMFPKTSSPHPNHHVKGGACAADYDEENDDTENLSVSSISQESIVRLQQVHLQAMQQQQQPQQPSEPPSENGSTLEGLDYAPSASEDHNYL
jgi:hypothetical protein